MSRLRSDPVSAATWDRAILLRTHSSPLRVETVEGNCLLTFTRQQGRAVFSCESADESKDAARAALVFGKTYAAIDEAKSRI